MAKLVAIPDVVLEHEIGGEDVTAFISALPLIRQHEEWTAVSCVQLFGTSMRRTTLARLR